jgi:hypothetical protein
MGNRRREKKIDKGIVKFSKGELDNSINPGNLTDYFGNGLKKIHTHLNFHTTTTPNNYRNFYMGIMGDNGSYYANSPWLESYGKFADRNGLAIGCDGGRAPDPDIFFLVTSTNAIFDVNL